MGELHRLTPRGAPDDGSSDLSCHRAKTKDSIARPWPFLTSVTVSASGQRDPVTLQSTCPAWRRLVHLGRYPAKTCLPIPRCRDVSGRGSDLPEVVEVAGRALELSHISAVTAPRSSSPGAQTGRPCVPGRGPQPGPCARPAGAFAAVPVAQEVAGRGCRSLWALALASSGSFQGLLAAPEGLRAWLHVSWLPSVTTTPQPRV